jgi:hypothetical protein
MAKVRLKWSKARAMKPWRLAGWGKLMAVAHLVLGGAQAGGVVGPDGAPPGAVVGDAGGVTRLASRELLRHLVQ